MAIEQKLADLIVERDASKKRMAQITNQIVDEAVKVLRPETA